MAAFNYRQLIRQIPARSWKFYFQTRKIVLPEDYDWDMCRRAFKNDQLCALNFDQGR